MLVLIETIIFVEKIVEKISPNQVQCNEIY